MSNGQSGAPPQEGKNSSADPCDVPGAHDAESPVGIIHAAGSHYSGNGQEVRGAGGAKGSGE